MSELQNRRIVLASRPVGSPQPENFRLETVPAPTPGEGEVLLKTLYMSLDPYMRGRMSDAPSYVAPVGIDEVMGAGTVARVIQSNDPKLAVGDLVSSGNGWQEYAVAKGRSVTKLDANLPRPSWALGVLGMPGFTAWYGLTKIGEPKPGETVVVAAATGGVGSVVGQVAKLKGCRTVGIAGGTDKCAYAVQTLGFDACIDHRAPDFKAQLKAACPDGIDIYFENVGGKVFFAVLPLLNSHARIPLCGLISQYSATGPGEGPDRSGALLSMILVKKARLQGFIISDHYDVYPEFLAEVGPWAAEGKVTVREDVAEGLENAPAAFMGLLEGRNFGKLVVHVAD